MSTIFDEQFKELRWSAREVVRVIDDRPHLLVRVAVAGRPFPHRSGVPVIRIIGSDGAVADSWFTDISEDGQALLGYFATDLPEGGTIEYGYHDLPRSLLPDAFTAHAVERLDRERLDTDIVDTTTAYLKRKRGF